MACNCGCDKCTDRDNPEDLETRSVAHFAWASAQACGGCSRFWAEQQFLNTIQEWREAAGASETTNG